MSILPPPHQERGGLLDANKAEVQVTPGDCSALTKAKVAKESLSSCERGADPRENAALLTPSPPTAACSDLFPLDISRRK